MIAVTGRKLSELMDDIYSEYGRLYMIERDYKFSVSKKNEIYNTLLIEKKLPYIPYEIDKISYLDGCKVYLKNGGWIIARFSGTEPLLRIFAEMRSENEANNIANIFAEFLELI